MNLSPQRIILPMAAMLAIAAMAIAAPFAVTTVTADHGEVNVRAGDGEAGYAVNLFLPDEITIHTGDTVTWDFPWFEPHSVTFGTPDGVSPDAPSVPLDETHEFDGESYFSSGLLAPEFSDVTTFSVQFNEAGSYEIYCAIHPFMVGTVNVVDDGDTDTQEDLDARADAEYVPALAELKEIGDALAAAPTTSTENDDGTTTFDVVVSAATMSGDVMQFFPPQLTVTEGDSVLWENDTPVPHTVTFNMQDYPGGDPFGVPRTADPDGFDGTGFTNSGIIGVDWPEGTTFELKFLTPGTYNYICILHANQGMVGTVTVEAAEEPEPTPEPTTEPTAVPTAQPTATPTTQAPQPPATGTGVSGGTGSMIAWYLAGALLVVLGGSSIAAARRR